MHGQWKQAAKTKVLVMNQYFINYSFKLGYIY